jgi:hypothetical protein
LETVLNFLKLHAKSGWLERTLRHSEIKARIDRHIQLLDAAGRNFQVNIVFGLLLIFHHQYSSFFVHFFGLSRLIQDRDVISRSTQYKSAPTPQP